MPKRTVTIHDEPTDDDYAAALARVAETAVHCRDHDLPEHRELAYRDADVILDAWNDSHRLSCG